jgi:hypothetical protein
MCATCLKPDGAEIRDLSILPPFADFFFEDDEDALLLLFAAQNISPITLEQLKGFVPEPLFAVLTFLANVFASPSSANTRPIMHSYQKRSGYLCI